MNLSKTLVNALHEFILQLVVSKKRKVQPLLGNDGMDIETNKKQTFFCRNGEEY